MPAFVILPFIQCHQVCGWAESGGLRKPVTSGSGGAAVAASTRLKANEKTNRRNDFIMAGGENFRCSRILLVHARR